ncbi:MAG: transposase, partial [Sphingobacteriaceae bacterium]
MKRYFYLLQPATFYHVFSRVNGDEKLFKQAENYSFFLQKMLQHIGPVVNVYAYSLLPNHFHFLIRIKPLPEIKAHYFVTKKKDLTDESLLSDFLMERFSNFLNAYAKAFNKMYDRKGSLFMDFLRRVEIKDNLQLMATVFYIHKNPVHHGCCKQLSDWPWSSYHLYGERTNTWVKTEEIL